MMKKRILVHMKNGSPISLAKLEGVKTKKNVLQVWSVQKKETVRLENTHSFLKVPTENELLIGDLRNNRKVAPEDFVHDWVIRGDEFYIFSKNAPRDESITLLLEVV